MRVIKKAGTSDQVGWHCSDCKVKKSIRAESFVSSSNIPMIKVVPLLYMWFLGGIERGNGGRAFAVHMKDRKQTTLFKVIRQHILPETLIISDEWRAYLMLEKHMPQYMHVLIRHKKKTGGGFSNKMALNDGSETVSTNKCERLWAHLKHKFGKTRRVSL